MHGISWSVQSLIDSRKSMAGPEVQVTSMTFPYEGLSERGPHCNQHQECFSLPQASDRIHHSLSQTTLLLVKSMVLVGKG